jgi:hypothetical protein
MRRQTPFTCLELILLPATYVRQSRDMDEFLLDRRLHLGPKRIGSAEIDLSAEHILQVELQTHEAIEVGLSLERDEDVQVTPFAIIAPRHRTEHGERLEPIFFSQGGGFGLQEIKDGQAVHGGDSM